MGSHKFDTERMCRLNGKKPTMRERWVAFYRLYRLAAKDYRSNDNLDALRVLLPGVWLRLCNNDGDHLGVRSMMPLALRRQCYETDRRERLRKRDELIRAIMSGP